MSDFQEMFSKVKYGKPVKDLTYKQKFIIEDKSPKVFDALSIEDKKKYFKSNYNLTLSGNESTQEIKYFKELLEDFDKKLSLPIDKNLPDIKQRKIIRSRQGTYIAGHRQRLRALAKAYAENGKENMEAIAKIKRVDLTTADAGMRKTIINNVKNPEYITSPVKTKEYPFPRGSKGKTVYSKTPGKNQTGISLKDPDVIANHKDWMRNNPTATQKDAIKAKGRIAREFPKESYGGYKPPITTKNSRRITSNKILDPLGIKSEIRLRKIGLNQDIGHSIKQPLLDPRKKGPQFKKETLDTLYPTPKELNRGKFLSGNPDSVINIAETQLADIAKQRSNLIRNNKIIPGKEGEFARLQSKGRRIVKNYSQTDELFGTIYKGAPGKASGAKNVKNMLNFEIFETGKDGILKGKLVGGDKAKSFAGLSKDPVVSKSFSKATQADKVKILDIANDQIKNLKKSVSSLKGAQLGTVCRTLSKIPLAKGGRVNFASGGSMANCLRLIDENPAAAVRAISSISKASGKLRGAVNIAKTIGKGVGYGVLAELAFAAPFAIADIRSGESVKRTLGNATYGLIGQTAKEEEREFLGEKGFRANELINRSQEMEDLGVKSQESFNPEDDMLISDQLTIGNKSIEEQMKAYTNPDGSFNEEQFITDRNIATAGLKNIEDLKKFRREAIQKNIANTQDPYANDFMAARGGIASLPRRVAKPNNYGIVRVKGVQ